MSPFDAALPSTEDLFSVIEAIHDNVAIVDHNGVMRWVSSCFERNYGISRDRVIGRTTYELEAEKVFSPSVAALVLKTRRVVTLTEATRSGQYNIVTGVPIYDDDGDVSFVVSYSVDMRYSRRLHEEYQKISALVSPNAPQTSGGLPFSGTMRAIAATIEKLAKVNTTVLITGESGVGKNVVARLVHHLSDRTNGPLVEINCAGIPAPLLESELFGYEAGAFTGASHKGKEGRIALADKGTLFLDEIGELPMPMQTRLLRFLQDWEIMRVGSTTPKQIDVRIVAATNKNLERAIARGEFRSDLYYRLKVAVIAIPPLRDRQADILPLARMFLRFYGSKYHRQLAFSEEAESLLLDYKWPGNIRELENLVQGLAVTSKDSVIRASDVPISGVAKPAASARRDGLDFELDGKTYKEIMKDLENKVLSAAMERYGSITEVARHFQVDRSTIFRKVKELEKEGKMR